MTEPNAPIEVPVAPPWKRDFPYQALSEEEVTRREFARYLVLGAGTIAVTNVGIAVWTQLRTINAGEPRPIIPVADIAIGETHLFRYPDDNDPAILVRLADTDIVAFSQKCTHLGCVVYYRPGADTETETDKGRWHCPCHEGNFDAQTGNVISGPPTRPLGRIDLEVRADGMIWALGRQT